MTPSEPSRDNQAQAPELEEDEVFSEAEEVLYDDDDEAEGRRRRHSDSDDEGEDLFDESQLQEDYEEDPEMDRYDPEMLDDTEQRELTAAERQEAERTLRRRERNRVPERGISGGRILGQQGVAQMFANLDLSSDEDDEAAEEARAAEAEKDERRRNIRRLREQTERALRPDPSLVEEALTALPECHIDQGTRVMIHLKLWNERLRELISIIFEGMIWSTASTVRDEVEEEPNPSQQTAQMGVPVGMQNGAVSYYLEEIQHMVRDERLSFVVQWNHIQQYCPRLTDWVKALPAEVFGTFDGVATKLTRLMYPKLYRKKTVAVRVAGYPNVDSIRHLTIHHINKLVVVEGVCMRRTDVLPRLDIVWYHCEKCGCDTNGPFDQRIASSPNFKKICISCQSPGPFSVSKERTVFENYQKAVIQEVTNSVPAGFVPRQKVVVLLGDLVDSVRPGDDLVLSGILEARHEATVNVKFGFPVFSTWIVANHVQKRREKQIKELTERDIQILKKLSKNPTVRDKIITSIAPSIWGHRHIKTAIAMVMFGGVRHEDADKHVVRGDINLLILGDPGMGKSQFLKYVEQAFPRTVMTTGKGASGVGLTAAVKRDPMTGEWTLEGGAFVLADEGICLIDEFDKMSDKDRISIHEAMEQQSISISKAGIVTSLRARCSVIAAANPIFGCYDAGMSLRDNVDLTEPILSRFDIVAVVRDQSFPAHDEHLANHVLNSHMDAHPESEETSAPPGEESRSDEPDETLDENGFPKWVSSRGRIPERVLRQYIIYARRYCRPELRPTGHKRLVDFYAKMRNALGHSGGTLITTRHFESILRMATANAKIRLARFVETRDIDFAISTLLESIIQGQKFAVATELSRKFGRFRALASSPEEVLDNILTDIFCKKMRTKINTTSLLSGNILNMIQEGQITVDVEAYKSLAKQLHGLPDVIVHDFINCDKFKSRYVVTAQGGNSYIIPKSVFTGVAA
eukprot:Blabericola_migrator_1__10655@NODE_607_length_7343_cov_208_169736_g440_i0_p1_GENE_NODE_607_length_7343_cov_208_169736_g440_i0NODE_607_length_7343_cov_208_169736_g440_i0_p1_ORF_typecomplete_len974_score216_94MCM/PF00493_23/2_5e97MCM_OB/PF17207_3/5_2e27MCM_lid/PF17855_1/1_2e18Mg_chelatase/PF01078_21/2_3e09MCM_N/PF14551_6/9_7e08MCM2_N/PF12619_8/4_5e02MCM2_N/PF12619_8/1_1e07MCM2_N/PF12619_8/2_9e03Sigma54_activat/PF00158_26/9_3e06AAA_5/PF07728_14/1_4e05AAA_3/PF07726_11/4_2e05AAA_3/PF07726_11/1_3e03Si